MSKKKYTFPILPLELEELIYSYKYQLEYNYDTIVEELKSEEGDETIFEDIFDLYEDTLKKYNYKKLKELKDFMIDRFYRDFDFPQYFFKTEDGYLTQDIDEFDIEWFLKQ